MANNSTGHSLFSSRGEHYCFVPAGDSVVLSVGGNVDVETVITLTREQARGLWSQLRRGGWATLDERIAADYEAVGEEMRRHGEPVGASENASERAEGAEWRLFREEME